MEQDGGGLPRFEDSVTRDLEAGETALKDNIAFVTDVLAREQEGGISGYLSLVHSENGGRLSREPVPGRLSGVNRVVLNRLYASAGADLVASTVRYEESDTGVDEIVEIPVRDAAFREITHGQMISGEFVYENARVSIVR